MAARASDGNPLAALNARGQSLWLDYLRRQLVTSGALARFRDEGVSGITSNPTIFDKAIEGSTDYDEALVRLARAGRRADRVIWDLMVEDVSSAARVMAPVHERTRGGDGFVSIEVSPDLAYDTRRTVAMARALWKRCDQPNVMVKIPATREGLPAITRCLAEGININVTLIFSVERHREVIEAFMSGLEGLRSRGGELSRVASVASFFVSRVDTKVDKLLEARIAASQDPAQAERLRGLLGRAGIANSKIAYEQFRALHAGPRWEALARAGARVQRCLWASTSVKDPRYPDTMYVEELIGPDTVDTVPEQTLQAFRAHGEVRRSLDENLDSARRELAGLAAAGVDLDQVTRELEEEGVKAFAKSYESLGATVQEAVAAVREGRGPRMWESLGPLQPAVSATVEALQAEDAPGRLWAKDASLWSARPDIRKEISDRLGWLDVPEAMEAESGRFRELARAGRQFDDVVVLGMGGSSLCPDVLRHTFVPRKGHPRLHVLDTTDPGTIARLASSLALEKSLFVVASKSGTTLETLSHFHFFWARVAAGAGARAGGHFAAVTDPGTPLAELAREKGFRWLFENPPDIGGRYSALSFFGLVPAALMGVDVAALLGRAREMAHACGAGVAVEKSPGPRLGAAMGRLAADGRDKLTLVTSRSVKTLGYWVEQLVAESTGKQGKGIVPVEGEPLGAPSSYGADRLFVHAHMDGDPHDRRLEALEAAGQPVVTLSLRDRLDLGAEFMRWEIAVAVAGSLIGIQPFDQPNVQESKDNTDRVLAEYERRGAMPAVAEVGPDGGQLEAGLAKLLGRVRPGSYFSVMAYTARSAASERAIGQIRVAVRDALGVATTAGYGPRFLHSTGQLHKGGPGKGVFLQVVQEDSREEVIPGQSFGFRTLRAAQALGDLQSLESRELPVLRVNLGGGHTAGWRALAAAVEGTALTSRRR
ncbi:MAG: bifunctional transaldolase/phosoglucose isomerase [Candidatus Dormibacterales bacterium]